jgi:hypothetical protein
MGGGAAVVNTDVVITSSDVLVRADRHVSAPIGEQVAMLDVDSGRYYLLDDIATFIWGRLTDPTQVKSLLSALQERYDVSPEQCDADVLRFLSDLHDKGLVRHVR